MIGLLINLLILLLIFGVAWWILTLIPLPPPFAMIVRVVFALILLLVLIEWLLPLGAGWHGPLLR